MFSGEPVAVCLRGRDMPVMIVSFQGWCVLPALAGIRTSPPAPLLPGHAGHGLVGFQLCGLSVVCGLCRASILAGLALMQGYASPLRSPGPSFPSAVIFRSFTRSDFAVSPCNSRQPCASGCGFPCAPASPPVRPAFMEARHRPVSRNM